MTRPVLMVEWERAAGGWIAAGQCGGWHWVPDSTDRWVCPYCRHISTFTLRSEQDHRPQLFYPTEEA